MISILNWEGSEVGDNPTANHAVANDTAHFLLELIGLFTPQILLSPQSLN